MPKHDHTHCDHELKHCDHCDVCYCTKCGMEWHRPAPPRWDTQVWREPVVNPPIFPPFTMCQTATNGTTSPPLPAATCNAFPHDH